MNDTVPIERPQARSPRLGVVVTLIAFAFAAGLALMAYALHAGWTSGARGMAPAPAAKMAVPAGGDGFVPAQPLNANGEAQVTTPTIDTAILATRGAALAGQLAALEARTAAIASEANAAGAQATRAEALLVAFSARRAIDRGLGLGYLEEQLRERFGQIQPRGVAIVIQASRQPVTLEDLRQGLETIAPGIIASDGDDWWQSLKRELGTLVVLRKAGTPSPLPADRLTRARRLLDGGQVEAARAEIALLPGAAQAGNWLAAARRYVVTRQALDAIENAALVGQPVPPMPAAVAAPVAAEAAAPL